MVTRHLVREVAESKLGTGPILWVLRREVWSLKTCWSRLKRNQLRVDSEILVIVTVQ